MRNDSLKKSIVAGTISVIILLSIFPVVSSVSCDKLSESVSEVAEGVVYCGSMFSPIPIITKPEEGCWYLNDELLFSGMPTTRILGPITVTVKCIDPTGYGVDRVEFKIDDELKGVDDTPTIDGDGYYWFEWLCDSELPKGEHEIKVVAFDDLNNWQSKSITVLKGLVLNSVEYTLYLEVSETSQTLETAGVAVVGTEVLEEGYYILILGNN